MEINKKYELLAPVGDMDMFEAAICAKADAVYLAGDQFGARAYASNFDLEELNIIVKKAHKNQTKVYLTVNTLIKDEEFKKLYNYLIKLAEIGVDALIIQDLGAYYFIKKHFEGFELHASTQMTVNNYYGAKFLEKLGFDRIVLGRETSLDEIKNIKKDVNLEIEFFVHGSLCVCLSGQCLMSSLIGQRSGNRGRCAQPCRKVYDIYSKEGKKLSRIADSFISARDLMTIDHIKEIVSSGAYSLKIEGRMKKPEYVYTVLKEYKKALEDMTYSKDDLYLVSNRSFTKGLFFGDFSRSFYNPVDQVAGLEIAYVKNSKSDRHTSLVFEKEVQEKDVISVLTKKGKRLNLTLTKAYKKGELMELKGYRDLKDKSLVYQLFSNRINENLQKDLVSDNNLDLDLEIFAHIEKKLKAKARVLDKIVYAEVDYIVEEALKKVTSLEEITKQMTRLGDTGYKLRSIRVDKASEVFLPKSRLNELRRRLVEDLDREFSKSTVKLLESHEKKAVSPPHKNKSYKLSYEFFFDYNKNLDLDIFSRIYCHDIESISDLRDKYKGEIFYVMPRMLEKNDYENLAIKFVQNINLIDGFSAQSLGDIEFLSKFEKKIHLDPPLNIFNTYALQFYRENGLKDFSLSHEVNFDQIRELGLDEDLIEIQAYGRLGQMILKHCPASIVKGCKDDSKCKSCPYNRDLVLENDRDRMLVNRAWAYSEVLTDKIIDLINEKEKIDQTRITYLRIVDRGEEDIVDAVSRFEKRFLKNDKFLYKKKTYTGHFNLGVI
ncbi:MAG: DUF3656 domain-containing protein [Tissierellia bacterium]|nr:DUF3656 domain-containing protein [Tissierellia bacterium]